MLKKQLSPRLQYNLWFILLFLLIIPFLPVHSFSLSQLFTWIGGLWTDDGTAKAGKVTATDHAVNTNQTSALAVMNDFTVSVSSKIPSWIYVLFIVLWIAGMIIMFWLLFRSWKRLAVIEKSALPLQNEKVRDIYQDCLRVLGIKKAIPVYSTVFFKSPVMTGLIRPCIYLPLHLISDFDPKDMRFMLLHELQHYRYKDTIISWLMNLAGCVYWFHPLIWYAQKEMRCDREIACDCAVLQLLPEAEYQAYGYTLLHFAEKLSGAFFPFAAGISGNRKQMKKRILRIAVYQRETLPQKIRGIFIYTLIAALLLCGSPLLLVCASTEDSYDFHEEDHLISLDVSQTFDNYDGSFVLYDSLNDTWYIYNLTAAKERISPNSTYKIYAALSALESGIISPEHSDMTWDGTSYPYEAWEANQNLNSAMQNSVNWYFQSLDLQLGLTAIRSFLQDIQYGSQTISHDVSSYWMDDSLKISPIEQVELLKDFHDNTFLFSTENIEAVKEAILLAATSDGSLHGKTGTGRVDGQDVNGWFVGYVETPQNVYYFATNIQGQTAATGSKASEITLSILADMAVWTP